MSIYAVHGSALFTRGETQALATVTLGDAGRYNTATHTATYTATYIATHTPARTATHTDIYIYIYIYICIYKHICIYIYA